MPGDKGDGLIDIAVGDRDARIGQSPNSRRNPRDHPDRNAVLHQCLRLFTAAPKHERIAAFEPQNPPPGLCQFDQMQRNVALFDRRFTAAFASIDQLRLRGPIQNARLDQCIINHHIGLPQRIALTTLKQEQQINTFMRLTSPSVIAKLRESFPDLPERPDAKTVFVKLRELRNLW